MSRRFDAQKMTEGEIPRSGWAGPNGSPVIFKPSAKLRKRLLRLVGWKIDRSSITFLEDGCEFHGGHATVSKARVRRDWHLWERRAEEVAVKKTRIADDTDLEGALGLALREAEFLVGFFHPNIVKLEGFVEDLSDAIIWLVFPWADNGNLRDFSASQDWEIPERISLINDVVQGLEYLHSRKPPICHGDLKSLNVLVNADYRAEITDFGSARRLTQHNIDTQIEQVESKHTSTQPLQANFHASSNTITLTGNKYTLRWAAPELLSEDQLSLWSDIWALGWIAYEVMTNSIPFQDVSADTIVVERVIRGDLPSLDGETRISLIQALCSLMVMCWKNKPAERPTADYCRKLVNWMPMVIPGPRQVTCTQDSGVRSLQYSARSGVIGSCRWEHAIRILNPKKWEDDPVLCAQLEGPLIRKARLWSNPASMNEFPNEDLAVASIVPSRAIPDPEQKSDTPVSKVRSPQLLMQLGYMYQCQGEYEAAFASYVDAHRMFIDYDSKEGRASALWSLAEVYRLRNEFKNAITRYYEALEIWNELGNRRGSASARCGLAETHRLRSEYDEAIALLCEALQTWTNIGDRQGKASALWGLAEVHRLRNECNEAITLYSKALQTWTEIGDRKGSASALWGLAEVHRLRNEYDEAVALYHDALHTWTDIGDRKGRASALWGLAEVHRLRNEYDEAVALYYDALQTWTDIGDRKGRASALWSLAEVHRLRSEYNEAIALYCEALMIWATLGDRKGSASALWGLAEVHRLRNECDEALSLYSDVLPIWTSLDNKRGRASTLWSLAEVYRLREEYSEALTLYSQALEAWSELSDRKGRADALCGLARVHWLRNEYSESIALYTEALGIRTEIGDRQGRADALLGLANVHRDENRPNCALNLYEQSSEIFQPLGNMTAMANALKAAANARQLLKTQESV